MLENISQKIAVTIGNMIKREIIITDRHAKIIGSTDETRLGDEHEASFRIMETGKPNPSNNNIKNLIGTREGFCLPVKLQSKTIGSVGITGVRKEVKHYCYLLKEHLETLLYEEVYLKSIAMRDHNLSELILDIAGFNPDVMDHSFLVSRATEMGYDLNLSYCSFIIEFIQTEKNREKPSTNEDSYMNEEIKIQSLHVNLKLVLRNTFNHPNTIITLMPDNKFVIFHAIDETIRSSQKNIEQTMQNKCEHVIKEFSSLDITAYIGLSTESKGVEGLKRAYEEAGKSLQLGNKNKENVFYYPNFMLEDAVDRIPNDFINRFMNYHLSLLQNQNDAQELYKTIKIWCESGFNRNESAEKLFIHRNTLDYRIKKIAKITDIGIHDYKNFITLYIAILMNQD